MSIFNSPYPACEMTLREKEARMLPIGRYVYNRTGNDNPQLRWGQNSLSYGGKTLRYADVTTLAFYFHHDVRYVNLVKNDDTLGYEIRINDLVLERRNSAFIRATASSKGMPPASKLETPLPTIFKYPLATMRLQMAFGSHSRSGKDICSSTTSSSVPPPS